MMQDIGLRLVTRVLAGDATITFNNDKLVRAFGFTRVDHNTGTLFRECTMINQTLLV